MTDAPDARLLESAKSEALRLAAAQALVRDLTDTRRTRIAELRASGYSLQAIGDVYGMTKQAVSKLVQRSTSHEDQEP